MNKMFIPKAHIIMGLCLPLAVLLGYFVAEPMDLGSLGVVALILATLSLPLLMKWYHPLLVFSCNAPFVFAFLPGALPLWLLAAMIGTFFFVLNQSLDGRRRFMVGGPMAWALVCLGVVVLGTAMLNGGIGFRAIGSAQQGGKRYFFIFAAVAAYFVVANTRVPASRARLYGGLFFLSSLAGGLSVLAWLSGGKLYGLYYFLGLDSLALTSVDSFGSDLVRLGSLAGVCEGGCFYLMFRYGAGGVLDLGKPWRAGLMVLLLIIGLLSGFRGSFLLIAFVFMLLFFLEGLHKTKHLFRLGLAGVICAVALVTFSSKLPLSMQRAVSYLPIKVDAATKADAQHSVDWRVEMWRQIWPQVPQYLLKGRGYAMNLQSVSMDYLNNRLGFGESWRWAEETSDFHSGPLSVLIPFGLWGALALGWFFLAAWKRLYRNYTHGEAALRPANRMLLAYFTAKVVFFVFVFGALYVDMTCFAILTGLAVSLNGKGEAVTLPAEEEPAAELDAGQREELGGYAFGRERLPFAFRRWES